MKLKLEKININNFKTASGSVLDIPLSYQIFGQPLGSAPLVLVNHALTGNSNVSGEKGWWNDLVGENKIIDTQRFSVLSFNIPGNGFDGNFIHHSEKFVTKDIARLFIEGLKNLNIDAVDYIIGGSLGGSIGWEMLALSPDLSKKFVPIATDYRTSDWLHAQCLIQQYLLEHPEKPLQKARIHGMLCYRTPESIIQRFQNKTDAEKGILKSHDWLNYHGEALHERFTLQAYKMMNQLLMNVAADKDLLHTISADIHLISVDTDLFFPSAETLKCYNELKTKKENVFHHQITSIHGHDAFLIEYEQITNILKNIFQ